jgi:hypothetical protein
MSYPNLTIGRTGNEPQYNINKFSYYSGSQITVWFGDIMIDDVVSIQWSRSQNKKPIYGYASQQFDAVAKGTVIIQGNFVLNFRQSGYLSLVMYEIKRLYGNMAQPAAWPVIRGLVAQHLKNGTFGPQTTQEILDIGNDPDFMQLAKGYESAIWGGGVPNAMDPVLGTDEGNQYVNTSPPDVRQHQYIPDGFNILITYGNTSGNDARTMNDYVQSSTKSLTGVHLIGESQMIQTGGQNVMEQYDFFARGTDEQVGTSR